MLTNLLVLPFLLSLCVAQNQRYVTVSTPQGSMQGARLDYGTNTSALYYGNAYSFLGVPYAQPPTGQLRFSEPVAVQSSSRVYNATYLRGRCPQPGLSAGATSEDCLYLNIITTQIGNSSTLSAVMVFIGGEQGFTQGGANQSDIPGTVRNLASRGVVVVTVQYRLGALGFFNLANSGVPQNLGMLDQVMALQWIQTNIAQFGGDPNKITLCGQADGACAVAAHSVSPMSNGLFQQAILQSGSIYTCYQDTNQQSVLPSSTMATLQYDQGLGYQSINSQQQQQQPTTRTTTTTQRPTTTTTAYRTTSVVDEDPSLQIAMMMCNVTSDQLRAGYSNARLRTCLQSLTVDVFIQFSGYRTSKWLIVRDNSFMPGSPDALAQTNSRRIPMIIGTVQDEDADYVFRMISSGSAAGKSEQQLFDGWFVDFAKKNKLNGTGAAQAKNIIESNYGITQQQSTPSPQQQYYNPSQNQNQNYANQNTQNSYSASTNIQQQYYNQNQNYGNQNTQVTSQTSNVYYNNQQQSYNQNQNTQMMSNNNYNMNSQQQFYNPSQSQNTNQNYQMSNNNYANTGQSSSGYQQSYTNTQFTQMNNGNGGNQTLQYLQVISKISSDAYGNSQSVSQVNLVQQQGSDTRIFQFTHVSELGRSSQPNTGDWKPVFRGQDQYFLFMSESVWRSGSPTAADYRVADEMGSRWTEFAKTGQVTGWQSTPTGQYNYCNINATPQMQANYAPQARTVFNDQVYPIVQQSTNTAPFMPSPILRSPSPSQNANVMVANTNGTSSWSISFSLPATFLVPNL